MTKQPDFTFLSKMSNLIIVLTIVPYGASVWLHTAAKSRPQAHS